MFTKLRIGEEEAKAPIVMCGYFNLNHAASTAETSKQIKAFPLSPDKIFNLAKTKPKTSNSIICIGQKYYYGKRRAKG